MVVQFRAQLSYTQTIHELQQTQFPLPTLACLVSGPRLHLATAHHPTHVIVMTPMVGQAHCNKISLWSCSALAGNSSAAISLTIYIRCSIHSSHKRLTQAFCFSMEVPSSQSCALTPPLTRLFSHK